MGGGQSVPVQQATFENPNPYEPTGNDTPTAAGYDSQQPVSEEEYLQQQAQYAAQVDEHQRQKPTGAQEDFQQYQQAEHYQSQPREEAAFQQSSQQYQFAGQQGQYQSQAYMKQDCQMGQEAGVDQQQRWQQQCAAGEEVDRCQEDMQQQPVLTEVHYTQPYATDANVQGWSSATYVTPVVNQAPPAQANSTTHEPSQAHTPPQPANQPRQGKDLRDDLLEGMLAAAGPPSGPRHKHRRHSSHGRERVPEGAPGKVLHEEATAAFQRLKREKERELNSIQTEYAKRLREAELEFAKITKLQEEEYQSAIDETSKLFIQPPPMVCEDFRERVLECYKRTGSSRPLNCFQDVQDFFNCVSAERGLVVHRSIRESDKRKPGITGAEMVIQ